MRHRITLVVVLVLLLAAGAAGVGYYTGRLGSDPEAVPVRTAPPCPSPTRARPAAPALAPSQVKVNVYNTTKVDGLAARAAASLRQRSFRIGTVSNDPQKSRPGGTAVVRFGTRGTAAARLVARQVTRPAFQRDGRKNASVDLVLGPAFRGLAPPVPRPVSTPRPTACRAATAPTSPARR